MKKLWVFGDSTTQEYCEISYPQQGWAYYLRDAVRDGVEYVNVASAGYSLKTFLYSDDYRNGKIPFNEPEKSRWTQILQRINKGDYFVFYCGGINDMGSIDFDAYRECDGGELVKDTYFTDRDVYLNVGKGYGTHTFFTLRSSVDEFVQLLSGMIEQIKAAGAEVLLVRGTGKYYTKQGNDTCVFPASHKYMAALRDVAKATNIGYLDVGSIFEEEFKTLGFNKMMIKYFLYADTRKYYAELNNSKPDLNAKDDNVHYNILGAKRICEIFLEEVKNSDCLLKNYLK